MLQGVGDPAAERCLPADQLSTSGAGPTKIIGNDRVTAVEVERTMINSEGFVVGIGRRPDSGLPILWCVRSAIAACR